MQELEDEAIEACLNDYSPCAKNNCAGILQAAKIAQGHYHIYKLEERDNCQFETG